MISFIRESWQHQFGTEISPLKAPPAEGEASSTTMLRKRFKLITYAVHGTIFRGYKK
jgi:hypothetical protein